MIVGTAGKRKRKRSFSQTHSDDEPDDRPGLSAPDFKDHSIEFHPSRRGKTQQDLVKTPLPATSRYLPTALGGSHWRGQESLEHIVIIGDSYSKLDHSKTWVDHLEGRLRKHHNPAQIYRFASPGATAEDDLSNQLARFFTTFPKKNSPDAISPLDPQRTTYFVFLGINDCGRTECDELESIIETILDAAHSFYVKAGARIFVFVDVPPLDSSPQAVDSGIPDEIEERVQTWNTLLQEQVAEFGASSSEATVLLFSSHRVLTEILEDPSEFDFSPEDPMTEGGGIWEDDLHLTTEVHDILAERLLASLLSRS